VEVLVLRAIQLFPMKCRTPKDYFQETAQFPFYRDLHRKRMNYVNPRDLSYNQKFHSSAFSPRVTLGFSPHTKSSTENDSESWACDYCNVATFRTYKEACEHESTCPMNKNSSTKKQLANQHQPSTPRFLLCMPTDKESLSDRQCYVRSHFVEMFEASENDVSARHSKGAQKLRVAQIGIRCMHCAHLNSKNRAERSTCFPSSISRIYQTVADMQRFHFEACSAIPDSMKATYKVLKTTRPRGQGSPQAYWIKSAKQLGLVDTNEGIRLSKDENNNVMATESDVPQRTSSPTSSYYPNKVEPLPPLSPDGSQSSQTTQSSAPQDPPQLSVCENSRQEEANMLLALRAANFTKEISN
jgi:hypothetical protein